MSKASVLYCLILKNIFSKNDKVNLLKGFPSGSAVKNLLTSLDDAPAYKMQDTQVQSLGWEFPLEEGMAAHSSILTWRIPWTEEPGGLQTIGLQWVKLDWSN